VTGGIGAYKAVEVARELQKRGHEVAAIMTRSATAFVGEVTFEAITRRRVITDQYARGANADIEHISLASGIGLLLVAPATANILGKFAHGIADDALTTLYLASTAPVLIAPAMNTEMFRHPAVIENLKTLQARGVGLVEPGSGYLACGWLGKGRLAEVGEIVAAALSVLERRTDLAGDTVLVTAGPTVEDIDPVRFVSNRSTGKMGYRLAEAARDRGATVVLVSGPTPLPTPSGIERVDVRSAEEMQRAVAERLPVSTILAMAAAVSDYRPASVAPEKIKKGSDGVALALVRNPDIVGSLAASKGDRIFVGFAAETEQLLVNARKKLAEKRLDVLVVNDVSREGAGFAGDTNAGTLIDRTGREDELPLMSKREMADRIWDRVVELRGSKRG
jgi:phosphopantothenoylcysteine decarboxylase / phosphopantothenate---cysteine ligase